MNKELTVQAAAEKYARDKWGWKIGNPSQLDYKDRMEDSYDDFLAGHSLALQEKDDRIKELEAEVDRRGKITVELYKHINWMQTVINDLKDTKLLLNVSIAELSALLLQREGEAVEFAEWVQVNGWYYEGGFYINDRETMKSPQQLHALFIESKNKK